MKSNRFINTLTMLATIAAFCLASLAVDVQAQDDQKEKPKAKAAKVQSPEVANGVLKVAVDESQPRMVKVYGASAGRVDGYATGIIVSSEGHILTTRGVFLDGRSVRVVTSDGEEHRASVLNGTESIRSLCYSCRSKRLCFLSCPKNLWLPKGTGW